MSAVDKFFESLSKTAMALDREKPFLNTKQYGKLRSAYMLIQHGYGGAHSSRAVASRYDRAQQHLKNALSLGNGEFLLVATTKTISQLGHFRHEDLYPRLETWFKDHPVSKTLEAIALRQIDIVKRDIEVGQLGIGLVILSSFGILFKECRPQAEAASSSESCR